MNFQNMREFIVLSDMLNFQSAADSLYLSQGTLSRHIQKMEQELGLQLFDRSNKSVKLTEFGKLFLPYARKTLELEQEYTHELVNISRSQESLSVCSINHTIEYGISELVINFCLEHPDTDLRLVEEDIIAANTDRIDEYDYVFLWEDSPDCCDSRHHISILSDPIVLLLPSDHPYASHKIIEVSELASLENIIPGNRFILDRYSKSGLKNLSNHINLKSAGTILNFVKSGKFFALFTERSVKPLLNKGLTYVQLHDSPAYLNLIFDGSRSITNAKAQFIKSVREHYGV